jgi:D-glycero-alpha-D-manno-heptose 1-phosphate guanylyltransferase
VLSLGHGRELIKERFGLECFGMSMTFIEEDEPLGTGGAILHAMKTVGAPDMIVMNGDTISDLDVQALAAFYAANKPDLAMAATLVADASRYGTIDFDPATRRLTAFREKRPGQGFINAGTYVVNAKRLMSFDLPPKFSFEQDFLGKHVDTLDIRVFPEVAEFIDIGIPADYERAQTVVPAMMEPRSSEA